MNKISIIGNLVNKAELLDLANGSQMAKFSVAVRRKRKNEDGSYRTDFFNCVAFGKLATDVIVKYSEKGLKVGIAGSMESQTKEDSDGKKTTYWNLNVDEFEMVGTSKSNEPAEKTNSIKTEPIEDDDNLPF